MSPFGKDETGHASPTFWSTHLGFKSHGFPDSCWRGCNLQGCTVRECWGSCSRGKNKTWIKLLELSSKFEANVWELFYHSNWATIESPALSSKRKLFVTDDLLNIPCIQTVYHQPIQLSRVTHTVQLVKTLVSAVLIRYLIGLASINNHQVKALQTLEACLPHWAWTSGNSLKAGLHNILLEVNETLNQVNLCHTFQWEGYQCSTESAFLWDQIK